MLDLELENEVCNDFQESLKAIDFKHIRPTAPEFVAALNVGTMWRLIHKINKREMELMAAKGELHQEAMTYDVAEEKEETANDMSVEIKEIKEKLEQVENSYNRYEATMKDIYHKFAIEELHQAELMIKDTGEKMTGPEYQDKMKCYEDWYISLHHKLNDVH